MNRHWKTLTERAAQVLAAPVPPVPNSVPSPCVSVCVMHLQTGWCEGCLRSLQEIGDWSRASDETKRQIWQQLPVRLLQRQALDR